MIKEDYVSFETAKLLKEKGFDGESHKHYWGYEPGKEFLTEGSFNPEYDYPAPTLQMAKKWLREVYKYLIVVGNKNGNYLYLIKDLKSNTDLGISNNEYIRYEEACEAAIKYCLENLI